MKKGKLVLYIVLIIVLAGAFALVVCSKFFAAPQEAYAAEVNAENNTGIDSITMWGSGSNVEPTQELYFEWVQTSETTSIQGRANIQTVNLFEAKDYTVKIAYIGNPARYLSNSISNSVTFQIQGQGSIITINNNQNGISEYTGTYSVISSSQNIFIDWFYNLNKQAPNGTYWINILLLQIYDTSNNYLVNYQSYLYDYLKTQFDNAYDQGAIDSTTPSENLIPDFTGKSLPDFKIYRKYDSLNLTGGYANNIVNPAMVSGNTWRVAVANWYDSSENDSSEYNISKNVHVENLTETSDKNTLKIGVGSDTYFSGTMNQGTASNAPIYGFYLYTLVNDLEAQTPYNFTVNLSRDYPVGQTIKTAQAFYMQSNVLTELAIQSAQRPYMDGIIMRFPERNLTALPEGVTGVDLLQTGAIDQKEMTLSGKMEFPESGSYIIGLFIRIDYTREIGFSAGEYSVIAVSDPYLGTGTDLGFAQGYQNGYNNGYAQGTTEGYNDGYQTGHDDGADWGHEQGYSEGYRIGMQESLGTVTGWDAVKNGFTSIFEALNIKIFGLFSLGDLMGIVLIFSVVMFFLKIIRG